MELQRASVVALVAAYNEEDRIAATVRALRGIEAVAEVVVVADGAVDRTAEVASRAGARVLSAQRRMGKGPAIDAALDRVSAEVFLLVDGDVGASAGEGQKLLEPVLGGGLDVAIGRLPSLTGGGFGLVKRMARGLISAATGFLADEPLSGQRAITAEALSACRPLAAGFGMEVAMTLDLARLGFRIGEVPVEMSHRPTGRNASGFVHRGLQGADILRAVLPRMVWIR
ncbi:MAG TPA: glycosyltransferase [Actinomycetota bacterium]